MLRPGIILRPRLRDPPWRHQLIYSVRPAVIKVSHTDVALVKNRENFYQLTSRKYYNYISRLCGPDNRIPAIEYPGKTGATGEMQLSVSSGHTHLLPQAERSRQNQLIRNAGEASRKDVLSLI